MRLCLCRSRAPQLPCVFISVYSSCAVTMAPSPSFFSVFVLHPSVSLPGSSSLLGLGTHQTPASITHRTPTTSPESLQLFFFSNCYIPAALWPHLLWHLPERYQACVAKAHTHPLFTNIARLMSAGPLLCILYMQKPRQAHQWSATQFMQNLSKAVSMEVWLKCSWVMLLYDFNYYYSVYHSY